METRSSGLALARPMLDEAIGITGLRSPNDGSNWPVRGRIARSAARSVEAIAGSALTPVEQPVLGDGDREDRDATLALILPLLVLLSTVLFLLLLLLVYILTARKRRGIVLVEDEGPLDLAREEEREAEGGVSGLEARWMDSVDIGARAGYLRAKAWQSQYPPDSQPTDITLSQFLSIQEKGVSAWSFEPDYESNPPLVVQSRTEIVFLADGVGLAPEEGGAACVQSNLPLPRLNEVYYWECKLFEKPPATVISVGLATRPFPSFRLPGQARFSVGYSSVDGFKSYNYPFTAQSYGPALIEGDVIGVGYRPRTGSVFFTKNGRKLDEAYVGLNKHNVFPTVGCSPNGGQAVVHVNLGQAGFVFIEANVKKWGLAPSQGTLAPPPAYGAERGSILLAAAARDAAESSSLRPRHPTISRQPSTSSEEQAREAGSSASSCVRSQHRADALSRDLERRRREEDRSRSSDEELPHNPPTPHILDISLDSMSPFDVRRRHEEQERQEALARNARRADRRDRRRRRREGQAHRTEGQAYDAPPAGAPRDRSPPAYHPIDQHTYAPGVAEAMLSDTFASLGVTIGNDPSSQSILMQHDSSHDSRYEATAASSRTNTRGGAAANNGQGWLSAFLGRSTSSQGDSRV